MVDLACLNLRWHEGRGRWLKVKIKVDVLVGKISPIYPASSPQHHLSAVCLGHFAYCLSLVEFLA